MNRVLLVRVLDFPGGKDWIGLDRIMISHDPTISHHSNDKNEP